MKCFKQLKAFKFFKDGHVQKIELSLISEGSSYCFVKASVLPSMCQDRFYRTWISVVKETAKCFQQTVIVQQGKRNLIHVIIS